MIELQIMFDKFGFNSLLEYISKDADWKLKALKTVAHPFSRDAKEAITSSYIFKTFGEEKIKKALHKAIKKSFGVKIYFGKVSPTEKDGLYTINTSIINLNYPAIYKRILHMVGETRNFYIDSMLPVVASSMENIPDAVMDSLLANIISNTPKEVIDSLTQKLHKETGIYIKINKINTRVV